MPFGLDANTIVRQTFKKLIFSRIRGGRRKHILLLLFINYSSSVGVERPIRYAIFWLGTRYFP